MSARYRIALLGFGAWGQMHARALAAIPEAEIVSIYCHGERSDAAAREAAPSARRFRSLPDLLAAGGFDVASVAVPNNRHAEFAIAALDAGAHVFLEKPLGVTLAECDAVIAAARRAGKQVAVNHELRVSHQWGKARELIAVGDIGRVRHQHFSLFRHPFRQGSGGWRYDREQVGSWILEELVHFVDLVLWYARENGPPASVSAVASSAGGMADTVSATLRWADGSTALVTQCLAGFQHHTLLEIAGEEGALRTWWTGAFDRTMTPDFAMAAKRRGASDVETIAIPKSGEVFELEEHLRQALAGFAAGRLPMPLEDARLAIAVCLAIEESARAGAPVDLRALTRS